MDRLDAGNTLRTWRYFHTYHNFSCSQTRPKGVHRFCACTHPEISKIRPPFALRWLAGCAQVREITGDDN